MRIERFNMLVRYAPLWAHLSVYALTCLVAAIPIYLGYGPFLILLDYFSGTIVPTDYSAEQRGVLLALFLVAPVLFAIGFFAAIRIRVPGLVTLTRAIAGGGRERDVPGWLPGMAFVVAASVGAYDLAQAGAFAKLGTWGDYGAWVQSRLSLFSRLGYFDFVNLYLILPVSAAWVMVNARSNGWRPLAVRWISLLIVVVLTLFLFQKKALVTTLILLFCAMLLHRALLGWERRLTWIFLAAAGLLVAVYFLLVVLPVWSDTSRTADEVLKSDVQQRTADEALMLNERQQERTAKRKRAIESLLGPDRSVHVMAYALLAPLTRTSVPAMYYPRIFPEQHEYYGLDLGQDILGWGGMPDDNLVVWKYMYPDQPGGAVAAPFQFVLYSQVGVGGALVLSVIVGALLGVLWQIILFGEISVAWRSLMGAVLLLFCIFLAIDSIRGSLLASYGVIWAWLFIVVSFLVGRTLERPCRDTLTNGYSRGDQ